jgi:archaetidylinositol phosphate synthase
MSHNTWIHRLVRLGVRPLAVTPVAPNHLTTLRLLTGLGASALFAVGGAAALVWGTGLFVLSMLLDRADGELARLSGKKSAFGHEYDLVADGVCNSLAFVGLGFGLRTGTLGPWAVPMGVLAGLAIAVTFYLLWRWETVTGEDTAPLSGAAGFDPDDALLLVPLLLWLGFAEYLLVAAAIAAPAFAVGFYWIFLRNAHCPAGYRRGR